MQPKTPTPSTQKVRRDSLGGKRGDGHRRFCRIRRGDPRKIHAGQADPGLTGYGGLAGFGSFIRDLGVDEALRDQFRHLKSGSMVVYPMDAQMPLLMDAAAVGERRVFGIESLSADPLFVHLAGGIVPSLDTIYRDLRRFDERRSSHWRRSWRRTVCNPCAPSDGRLYTCRDSLGLGNEYLARNPRSVLA